MVVVGTRAHAEDPQQLYASCTRSEPLEKATQVVLRSPVDRSWNASQLLDLAREHGSDVPSILFLAAPRDQSKALRQWFAEKKAGADAPLVCGMAEDSQRTVVLASSQGGQLQVRQVRQVRQVDRVDQAEPHPRTGTWIVQGDLIRSFRDPTLVIRRANQQTVKVVVSLDRLRAGIPLSELEGIGDELSPPFAVQLVAHGPWGPRPVAERVVGQREQLRPRLPPRGASLPERLTWLRDEHRVPRLRNHKVLTKVAVQHATTMCTQGRMGHTLAPGDTPRARVEREGITAQAVGEALARAMSDDDGLDKIIESPSHFALVVDRKFTDVGIGTAVDGKNQACVVIVLAAWPRWKAR